VETLFSRETRTRRGGFTLIEVTVVALLLGLIASSIFMSWEALVPNQKLNSAIRNLSETLYGTRSDAIARNGEFRIYYDIDNESYIVRTPFREGGGFAHSDEDEGRVWKRRRDLTESRIQILEVTIDDVTYTDGEVYVRFDPLGASSYHTVVLFQEQFERTFTIEALPLTGEIRFHDGYFRRELARDTEFQ
jgi:prepilin-type N-terminal cleavage/methylation domain-containing protein